MRSGSDSTDSFHIFEDAGDAGWCFKDFVGGEGGDFTHLVELCRACTPKEAAEWILAETGNAASEQPKRAKKAKAEYAPAAADCEPVLSRISTPPDLVTKYRNADKTVAFAILRWNAGTLEADKVIRPIYPTASGGWAEGLPEQFKKSRPLLGLHRFTTPRPVLIVEGEAKAGEALTAVPSRLVTTWHGGADNAQYLDTAPVQDWPDIVIWPDHDEPGRKAALALKAKLPQAEILDVWNMGEAEGKDGWDVADCIREGYNPELFIDECPRLKIDSESETEESSPAPFRCIGYDAVQYWFLLGGQRQPYTITKGHFTGSLLGELASPAWWSEQRAIGDKGAIDVTKAQQIVIDKQKARGIFNPDILRGSGVWLDRKEIIINDGERIVRADGSTCDLAEYDAEAVYVRSSVRFGDMTGDESSDDDGRMLVDLFSAQKWSREVDAVAALGWSLIAPFGGLLKFRPHIWASGPKGTGKTFVLEELIARLCGPFAHQGSGKDTEPGIRRTLNMDARPVILDEMEPKGKARENIQRILDLARNSSSDGSGRVTMADGKGTAQFLIRSCFCFASINTVVEEGAAIASRIITLELSKPRTDVEEARKVKRSRELYLATMRDPGRYRRRIFRALPRITSDIVALRDRLPAFLGGLREADLWAPILAAAWAVQSAQSITSEEGMEWLRRVLDEEHATRQVTPEDEDRVIEHLLTAPLDTDDHESRTVAELLSAAALTDYEGDKSAGVLARNGLRILDDASGRRVLAIAVKSDAIARILRDTVYGTGYDAQIKRHPLCLTRDSPKKTIFAKATLAARHLDWHGFREQYMGGAV